MSSYFIFYIILGSALTFIATLIFIPLIIIRIPSDYFEHEQAPSSKKMEIPKFLHLSFLILKNILGLILFIGGFIMLFIPGQGILSMIIGISLTNFPGKRTLERHIIANKKIFALINKIRKNSGVSPLTKPKF
jgi:archaellum biogenesis protein FlaJ (TadC family)